MRRISSTVIVALAAALMLAPSAALARPRMPPQFIAVSAGYGLSDADHGGARDGEGVYLEAEYYLVPSAWFSPRAYAGTLLTFSPADSYCRVEGVNCDVSAKIGFLGVKGRLTIPIPYVAPFLELGIGASIGAMRTRTLDIDERMAGATYHIPFSIGLSLGEDHNIDLAFFYLYHPTEKQVGGAIAAGFGFQISR